MASYAANFDLSQLASVQQKLEIAMIRSAITVMAEANAVTGHALRTAFANKVLLSPTSYIQQFALAMLSQDNVTGATSDAAIQTASDALWNAFSGVVL